MTPRALFIGRFQAPRLHEGHTWLIDQALKSGKPVLILVREMIIDEDKNPYSPYYIINMITKHYQGQDVIVKSIPDIESVNYGRDVGYKIIEHKPPPHIGKITATAMRKDWN